MTTRRTVTLDGPAGVGKTTLAKQLATHLGIAYLDTGAMYRAIALELTEALGQAPWERPEAQLLPILEPLHFSLSGSGTETTLRLNDMPVNDRIRTEEVARWASNIARLEVVRASLTKAQRSMGSDTSLVAEGRDMGSVVFPQAWRKFFLDASPSERARRRVAQLKAMGKPADFDTILAEINTRDFQDRNRAIAPLVCPPDAIAIDTTDLDIAGVFEAMVRHLPRS